MHPDLKALIELQQLDLKIAELEGRIARMPAEIATLEEQLQEFLHALEANKSQLAENQKLRRLREGEIQDIQTKISRHKDQLYEVKTNEQYRALLHEIELEEGKVRKLEDLLLERMLEAEQLEKLIRESEARLNSERARVAGERQRLVEAQAATEATLAEARERRRQLEAGTPPDILETYHRVQKARRGIALAEARDGFCGACNVRLLPQVFNEARKNETILTCESCNRILYYVERPAAETPEVTRKNDLAVSPG